MIKLVKNKTIHRAVLFWAAFWPLAYLLPRPYLFDVVNALVVSISIGVLVAYAPGIISTLRENLQLQGGHYLILGIACTWFATPLKQTWAWVWRWSGRPEWMVDHTLLAFAGWVIFGGGVLHLTAKNAIGGRIPRQNWLYLGIIVAVGCALSMLVIALTGIDPIASLPIPDVLEAP